MGRASAYGVYRMASADWHCCGTQAFRTDLHVYVQSCNSFTGRSTHDCNCCNRVSCPHVALNRIRLPKCRHLRNYKVIPLTTRF